MVGAISTMLAGVFTLPDFPLGHSFSTGLFFIAHSLSELFISREIINTNYHKIGSTASFLPIILWIGLVLLYVIYKTRNGLMQVYAFSCISLWLLLMFAA